jgi:hypothetical protein
MLYPQVCLSLNLVSTYLNFLFSEVRYFRLLMSEANRVMILLPF